MIDQEKKVGDPKKLWGDGRVGRDKFPRDSLPVPPAQSPWHSAEWEKPARHTGTLQLLSDPKYIKKDVLTPATRSGSGMNWEVVKISDLSLFSQEKYLFH